MGITFVSIFGKCQLINELIRIVCLIVNVIAKIGHCSLLALPELPRQERSSSRQLFILGDSRSRKASRRPRGFAVSRVEPYGDGLTWLALTRCAHGSLELFAAMVADVAHTMDSESSADEKRLLQPPRPHPSLPGVHAQGAQALSPESEIGLVGKEAHAATVDHRRGPAAGLSHRIRVGGRSTAFATSRSAPAL